MGTSSSLLDENKYTFITDWVQRELSNFTPIYKKQYTLAFLSHVHDELVQRKRTHTRLLAQRDPPPETEVLYQTSVLCFGDNRKWKERFVVLRANYSLECHESYETFTKGTAPLKLMTTGGTIFTTEEKYMEAVDGCFTDTDSVKEDFAPPVVGMPGQFPVYLQLPYQRHHYFCLLQEAKHTQFMSLLSDCIRHQNQDFLKKETFEVQAFIKAVQLYRQGKGYYESWDMMMGNDVQVLSNLTMADLLPSLEKDLLARLKTKKNKRMWFATVEAVYNVVQETFMVGMAALNDECRDATTQQNALMRSHMDQIMSSRAFLESKLRDTVAELANKYCSQHIEPHLNSVLEEIMAPISLGFGEAREVSESMMEHLCQTYQEDMTREDVQQNLVSTSKPDLQSCYERVSGLKDNIQEFNYSSCRGLEHSTQIDIQQLVDSVGYTFGLLLSKSPQDNNNLFDLMVKAKNRVLKQYDHDSSTQRKKIFQEALFRITLPRLKAFLAPTFEKELLNFDQYIFADYVNFIDVENVYEDILEQILEKEISKVVKEAASMKKYNLFKESRYRFSVSGMYFTTPPGSPAYTSKSTKVGDVLPPSLLLKQTQCTYGDPVLIEKMLEPETIGTQMIEVKEHAQPALTEVPLSEATIMAEKTIEQKVIMADQEEVPPHAQPELITIAEIPVLTEKAAEKEVVVVQQLEERVQAECTTVSIGEDRIMAEKMIGHNYLLLSQEEIQAHAQPEFINVSACVEDPVERKPGDSEGQKAKAESLEEKTYSVLPFELGINPETSEKPPVSSNTEPGLKPESHASGEFIPTPLKIEVNATLCQTSPPERDTRPVDQVFQNETPSNLTFVSAGSDVETVLPSSSDGQPFAVEEQTNNPTTNTKLAVHDRSPLAPFHELRDSNTTEDLYNHISWSASAAQEGNEVNEPTPESTTVTPNPEDIFRVKCEAISDVGVSADCADPSTEAARPLDCIKEIRDLVVEVIEVEEIVQHYPDNAEVDVNTQ